MALDKAALKSAIKSGFEAAQTQQDKDAAANSIADAIANAIDAFVKSGAVNFTAGAVTGTCGGPGAPLTVGAASNGTIS